MVFFQCHTLLVKVILSYEPIIFFVRIVIYVAFVVVLRFNLQPAKFSTSGVNNSVSIPYKTQSSGGTVGWCCDAGCAVRGWSNVHAFFNRQSAGCLQKT